MRDSKQERTQHKEAHERPTDQDQKKPKKHKQVGGPSSLGFKGRKGGSAGTQILRMSKWSK